jgi:hypothetical protein
LILDVVNGEKNALTITVENKSGRNVTLLNVAGALLNADTNVLLKNVCLFELTPFYPLELTAVLVNELEVWNSSHAGY